MKQVSGALSRSVRLTQATVMVFNHLWIPDRMPIVAVAEFGNLLTCRADKRRLIIWWLTGLSLNGV